MEKLLFKDDKVTIFVKKTASIEVVCEKAEKKIDEEDDGFEPEDVGFEVKSDDEETVKKSSKFKKNTVKKISPPPKYEVSSKYAESIRDIPRIAQMLSEGQDLSSNDEDVEIITQHFV
jgi:hypothetical protein